MLGAVTGGEAIGVATGGLTGEDVGVLTGGVMGEAVGAGVVAGCFVGGGAIVTRGAVGAGVATGTVSQSLKHPETLKPQLT